MSLPHPRPRAIFKEDAVARAEEALRAFSAEFDVWMADEVEKVHHARMEARAANWNASELDALFAAAHDAKGLGATYEYPLITDLAASLCRLLETEQTRAIARANAGLIGAHVDAMRAAVRDKIKRAEHPVGRALLRELTGQLESLGIAAKP